MAERRRKTHCKYGHAFTPENTRIVHPRPGWTTRHCRLCGAARVRTWYRRQVARPVRRYESRCVQ